MMSIDIMQNKGRPAEILLVEDNRGDIILTKKAFKGGRIVNNITVAMTGEEAIMILNREGEHANARKPDLILLDLNLPRKSGREVLQEIKASERLRHIPVVILTSSRAEIDVVKSYNLHANSYVLKPSSHEMFANIVQGIENFWFSLVMMPDEVEMQKNFN